MSRLPGANRFYLKRPKVEAAVVGSSEAVREDQILLDLSGLKCPLPALLLERALKGAQPGTVFVATATDPMAEVDLPYSASKFGATVLAVSTKGGCVTVTLKTK